MVSIALPYHEPSVVVILILSSFIILGNGIGYLFDKFAFCGLVGQVLLGIAWGTPAGNFLPSEFEHAAVQLGYLGLILLVYEGGLSTNLAAFRANLFLSVAVALTGIAAPIGLSYVLQGLVGASALQAFTAGAALCSTSLGTSFTVLSSSGLTATRLGVVLTSAAMMDDIVGLVMVQVISNIGGDESSLSVATVLRPISVSIGFALATPAVCLLVAKPITLWLNEVQESRPQGMLHKLLVFTHTPFLIHTGILIAFVTAATYAGTSNLFSAYLAGASIGWWDSDVPHPISGASNADPSPRSPGEIPYYRRSSPERPNDIYLSTYSQPMLRPSEQLPRDCPKLPSITSDTKFPLMNKLTGVATYQRYYRPLTENMLRPFFFASIGFSIPISRMFSGIIIWRGIVYTILMAFGKLICGLWLLRFSLPQRLKLRASRLAVPHIWGNRAQNANAEQASQVSSPPDVSGTERDAVASLRQWPNSTISGPSTSPLQTPSPRKHLSLYPPFILGSAMVARGEIGFLVSSLANSRGIFSSRLPPKGSPSEVENNEIFLVVTWAIMLCTIVGPLSVGLLVRRVKRLEDGSGQGHEAGGRRDTFGVLGVE